MSNDFYKITISKSHYDEIVNNKSQTRVKGLFDLKD